MTKRNKLATRDSAMKKMKLFRIICIVISIFAALKMLFFAYGLDEEYQVVMSYRSAMGDSLLGSMWEPHQTSAFLCMVLMKLYLLLFHTTTGIVIYLRICGTLIHLGISYYLYRVVSGFIGEEYAFYISLIYFNTIPKQIMLPEFGIMQVWFFTLITLFFMSYYVSGMRKKYYLILAGFAMVGEVLSYPSCVILYPFFVYIMIKRSVGSRMKDIGIFTFVCVLCGIVYLLILLHGNSWFGLFSTVKYILNGDVTHSAGMGQKLLSAGYAMLKLLGLTAIIVALSACIYLFYKTKYQLKFRIVFPYLLVCAVVVSCITEIFFWVVLDAGYETMQIHLFVIAVCGIIAACILKTHGRSLFMDGIWGSILSLIAVAYLTDLTLIDSIPHAMLASFWGMILLIMLLREKLPAQGKPMIYLMLIVWCITAMFGKGYALRSGVGYNNVLESGGIMKYGPAIGTVSSYMGAYVYNCDYEDWQQYIQDGDNVLIVVNQVMNLDTTQYLFKKVGISHYSVVNPTAYDDRLLHYWMLYPGKQPNVIIVDCWYGQLMTDENSWIMQYIQNDFGYKQVNDGRYIRIYRK